MRGNFILNSKAQSCRSFNYVLQSIAPKIHDTTIVEELNLEGKDRELDSIDHQPIRRYRKEKKASQLIADIELNILSKHLP